MGSEEDLPDLSDLERFAESLLQEAIASDENVSEMEQVVGQASKFLESSRPNAVSLTDGMEVEKHPVEVIPHNIPRSPRRRIQARQSKQNPKKVSLKEKSKILDPVETIQQELCFNTGTPTCLISPRKSQPDIIASALHSAFSPDQCITIIVPSADDMSDCVILGEAVQEVSTSCYLSPSCKDEPLSPRSDLMESIPSDYGYESLDSPHSDVSSTDMSDLWNESFSQLFPNLS